MADTGWLGKLAVGKKYKICDFLKRPRQEAMEGKKKTILERARDQFYRRKGLILRSAVEAIFPRELARKPIGAFPGEMLILPKWKEASMEARLPARRLVVTVMEP